MPLRLVYADQYWSLVQYPTYIAKSREIARCGTTQTGIVRMSFPGSTSLIPGPWGV